MVKLWLKNKIKELYPGTDFDILTPPNPEMGDYSINLAFALAKKEKKSPAEISEKLAGELGNDEELKKYFKNVGSAGGGFVNFYFSDKFLREQLLKVSEEKEHYGSGEDKKLNINLEFVSANPTGPLTVGNARAASYGDALANILKKAGYNVAREYYINDAGNQIRLLGESVARRYLRIKGRTVEFPDNLYQGEYVIDIAKEIDERGVAEETSNFDNLVEVCTYYSIDKLLSLAKKSLTELGVKFDVWFSERSLYESGEIENTLKLLGKGKHTYEKDGAKWLKINDSGGSDAVLVKSDGSFSYLMGDIAYTRNKFIRGFNRAINIWGADHYGDVARLLAGISSLGYEENKLEILLHQLVFIKRGGELQKMSKRKGEFVLLDELLKEAGKDSTRFFFLMKDLNTHMEFDVDLAKEQSKKNPVYYIQYAHSRLNSIFQKLKVKSPGEGSREAGIASEKLKTKEEELNLLKEPEELLLMRKMAKFPELMEDIAQNYQVNHLAQYTLELAGDFHNFYEKHRVGQEDKKLQRARLALCGAIMTVLKLTLGLMGISAPDKM